MVLSSWATAFGIQQHLRDNWHWMVVNSAPPWANSNREDTLSSPPDWVQPLSPPLEIHPPLRAVFSYLLAICRTWSRLVLCHVSRFPCQVKCCLLSFFSSAVCQPEFTSSPSSTVLSSSVPRTLHQLLAALAALQPCQLFHSYKGSTPVVTCTLPLLAILSLIFHLVSFFLCHSSFLASGPMSSTQGA